MLTDHEHLQVGVDPVGESQVHQHGASYGTFVLVLLHRNQLAVFIGRQQEKLLNKSQHDVGLIPGLTKYPWSTTRIDSLANIDIFALN